MFWQSELKSFHRQNEKIMPQRKRTNKKPWVSPHDTTENIIYRLNPQLNG